MNCHWTSVRQVFFYQLGQAQDRYIHVVFLQPFFEVDAAVTTGCADAVALALARAAEQLQVDLVEHAQPAGADRVPEGDRAAVDVSDCRVEAELGHATERLRGETAYFDIRSKTGKVLVPCTIKPRGVVFRDLDLYASPEPRVIRITKGDGGPINPKIDRATHPGIVANIVEIQPGAVYEVTGTFQLNASPTTPLSTMM